MQASISSPENFELAYRGPDAFVLHVDARDVVSFRGFAGVHSV